MIKERNELLSDHRSVLHVALSHHSSSFLPCGSLIKRAITGHFYHLGNSMVGEGFCGVWGGGKGWGGGWGGEHH